MKSYLTLRNLYGVDTKNTSTANLSHGDQVMNDFHRRLLAKANWPFLHRARTLTTFSPDSAFTAVVATDVCTATKTILTLTGTEVTFSSTTTLPTGLSASTTYYLIYQSATTFKVATSFANALAGAAIDITDTGTGTHTVTVATKFWPLPYDVDLVESVSVTVGTTIYTPKPSPSKKHWDELQTSPSTSDTPSWWFVQDEKFALWPRPATSGKVIELNTKIRVPDLNIVDYTTGTVASVANGSPKVTGTSTVWTAPMAGRWLRITHSDTATSSGDGEWYRIDAVESATILYLSRPYGGRTLASAAGASYAIGHMPLLPEAFHDLPETFAAYRYWLKEKDERADGFKELLTDGVSTLFSTYGVSDLSMVIDSGDDDGFINPNLAIQL
uniref:Putative tail protein n=1 Tax=viral metagenome TaxID=1070528 RepID=A0A6H1ZM54_9ZZZZ